MGKTFGGFALACGILGILCFFAGIVLGPLAMLFGVVGLKNEDKTTLSIIGIVLGIIAIVLWILFFILWIILFGIS